MSFLSKLNKIEINQEGYPDMKNMVKVDGKQIQGVRNVKIEYGINTGLPIITIEFYAKIKGKIKIAQGVSDKEALGVKKEKNNELSID